MIVIGDGREGWDKFFGDFDLGANPHRDYAMPDENHSPI
jgi:hypothetical protein